MQRLLRSASDPAVRMAIYPQLRVVKNICMDDSFTIIIGSMTLLSYLFWRKMSRKFLSVNLYLKCIFKFH